MRRRFSVEGRKKVVNEFEIRDVARQLMEMFCELARLRGGAVAAHAIKDDRRTRHLFYACFEDLTQEAAWTVHIREVVNNWEKLGVRVTLFAPGYGPFRFPRFATSYTSRR